MRKFGRIVALGLLVMATVQCSSKKSEWRVEDFGAVADGTTLNTQPIQLAIDACYKAGGGKVILDKGVYLSGTILLKDNVTLVINKKATLRGSRNPYHYTCVDAFTDATGQYRGECLVGAIDATNIGIKGEGKIEGQGEWFVAGKMRETFAAENLDVALVKEMVRVRPFMIRLVRSNDIEIEDLRLEQAAAWCCHLFECSDIEIEGLSIYSHANRNNDGIDFDACSDASVSNCDIDTGDDALCFKATSPMACQDIEVEQCKLKSDWGAIKFGTEAMGDFRNIKIEDCHIYDTRGGGIKILSVDGANIRNIEISDITMDRVDMPIFIRLGERLRTYRDAPVQEVGSISGVKISDIKATTRATAESRVNPPAGIFITGTPNHYIESVTLEDISITLPGGGTKEHALITPPEDITSYPEFSFFGVLPAYGLNARYVENLKVEDVTFKLKGRDARGEEKLMNVNNYIKL